MKGLIWKEARELAPVFGILLGACVGIGLVDLGVDWYTRGQGGFSLGFCWIISLAAAFLAATNAFARESRGNVAFLSSWPVSRGHIWAAKVLVTATHVVLLAGLSFGISSGLLAWRAGDLAWMVRGVPPGDAGALATLAAVSFGLGVMFSSITRTSATAAGLTIVMGTALWAAYTYSMDLTPHRWLWLQAHVPIRVSDALTMSTWALLASAWGFVRTPVLEDRRRLALTLCVLAALLALSVLAAWLVVLQLEAP